jgi:hypothetical protein
MLEPLVQDYIELALRLERDAFKKRLVVPVLVALTRVLGQSFQTARTRLLDEGEKALAGSDKMSFSHQSAVWELRPSHMEGEVQVGRSEENDLVIDEEEVSSKHSMFRVDRESGKYWLQDLESTNGTFVNATLLMPGRMTEMKSGDILSFGNIVFQFFYPEGFFDVLRQQFSE